jgi:hypothetical protein
MNSFVNDLCFARGYHGAGIATRADVETAQRCERLCRDNPVRSMDSIVAAIP